MYEYQDFGNKLVFKDKLKCSELVYDFKDKTLHLNGVLIEKATQKLNFNKRKSSWINNIDGWFKSYVELKTEEKSISIVKLLMSLKNNHNLELLLKQGIKPRVKRNWQLTRINKLNVKKLNRLDFDILKSLEFVDLNCLEFALCENDSFRKTYESNFQYLMHLDYDKTTIGIIDDFYDEIYNNIFLCLTYLYKFMTPHKLNKYIEYYKREEAVGTTADCVIMLYEWYYMNEKLDVKNYNKCPRYIKSRLDIVERNFRVYLDNHYESLIKDNQRYKIEGYKNIESKEELNNVANKFKNCLSTYLRNIALDDCNVVYNDKHCVEVSGGKIVQIRGFKNKRVNLKTKLKVELI